jgi:small GTP-binding protein
MDDNLYLIKLIVIGNSGVGKSSLSEYYILKKPASPINSPTIGVEFYTKIVNINKKLKLQIWDTAGQEKYRSITRAYFRDAYGAIICFSITDKQSYEDIKHHIKDLEMYGSENVVKLLVGTCTDLNDSRVITKSQGKQLAKDIGAQYIETSSVNGYNIDKAFDIVLKQITIQINNCTISPKIINNRKHEYNNNNNSTCC